MTRRLLQITFPGSLYSTKVELSAKKASASFPGDRRLLAPYMGSMYGNDANAISA